LRNNQNLLHLELSDTGLTKDVITGLIKPIHESTSLISVHLSGNPGLTPDMQQEILCKLNATYEKPLYLKTFQQTVGENLKLRKA